jgi:5-methylthioadenosine/S-adenosylhomocysteine deaminase
MTSILIKNGTILTMNPSRSILQGAIYIEDGRIAEIPSDRVTADSVIDASNRLVLPGFIQVHVHLNQTLFRGIADDMDVVDWLKKRIWPLEKAHNPESVYASARLSILEMIRSGTTSAVTLETINHTEAAFQAAEDMGFRATIGNAMMDRWEIGTEMIGEGTDTALRKSIDLLERFHGKSEGRLRFGFCPRGTRNATDELWKEVGRIARERNVLVHTHAAENRTQTERLEAFGGHEVHYLNDMGVLGPNLVIAHAIWLTPEEHTMMAASGCNVAHCPSANLKLASGFAPVPEMMDLGINVALGADGAPCNNNLDAFVEMRLAGLIHKPRCGSRSMPAGKVLEMVTLNGAKASGLQNQIGSLETGKQADVILLKRDSAHVNPMVAADPVSTVVYGHQSSDVDTVIIDGKVILREGRFLQCDEREILSDANRCLKDLLERLPEPLAEI